MAQTMKEKLKQVKAERWMVRLLSAYALGSLVLLLWGYFSNDISYSDVRFMEKIDFLPALLVYAVLFLLVSVVGRYVRNFFAEKLLLFSSMTVYFAVLCFSRFSAWFFLFLCIFVAVGVWYCFSNAPPLRKKMVLPVRSLVFALAMLWFGFFSVQTGLRYAALGADNYDMAVYSQMFYHMAAGEGPLTSCAEFFLRSRFETNPAPILYVLLPLWMLTRSMLPCLILQALALTSGVLPLYLICRSRGMNDVRTLFFSLCYLFFGGLWAGIFYDFHEQSLLVPLLLWMLWCAERKKEICFLFFSLLALAVGPEGILCVFAVAVYTIFSLKCRKSGITALVLSLLCFVLTELFLPEVSFFATGDLDERELGRFLLMDPGYLLKQWFSAGKGEYLILMLLPLAAVPLLKHEKAAYILLLPFFTLGFLSPDAADSSVYYQHAFAPAALLLYLFAIRFPAVPASFRHRAAVFCLTVCLLSFCGTTLSGARNVTLYQNRQAILPEIKEALSVIPDDASVTASSNLTPLLAERDYLYPDYVMYEENGEVSPAVVTYDAAYVALELFTLPQEYNEKRIASLLDMGYELIVQKETIVVMQKTEIDEAAIF